ncbi:MAG: glycosyltransferase, partial [Moorea sp. SIO4E2]|nr:glycosyltransferase [Moorena sp. SIO4E2]
MSTQKHWICCQIGAREHYAIPRSLHQQGNLSHLITDAWITPQSPLNYLPKNLLTSLRDRFHPDLAQASTHAFTNSLIQL